jgi:poly-gamma-glutamate synthesis protein (capsule biosynthesis protein)
MNLAEAQSPGVVEAGVVSFAFLDFNSIIGSLNATSTTPGVAWIRMKPWSKDSPEDMELVKQSIQKAKSQGNFVVACFHWSAEYTHKPSDSQRNMGHLACDAGADLVIGSHPHCTQAIEMYNGKLIAYSLGNFIFDQMEHDYSREGVIMKCRFNGTLLTSLELVPYVITDWCQPVAVSGLQAKKIMDELLSVSGY